MESQGIFFDLAGNSLLNNQDAEVRRGFLLFSQGISSHNLPSSVVSARAAGVDADPKLAAVVLAAVQRLNRVLRVTLVVESVHYKIIYFLNFEKSEVYKIQ